MTQERFDYWFNTVTDYLLNVALAGILLVAYAFA